MASGPPGAVRYRTLGRGHGIVSGIIIPPNFRQADAKLDCEKKSLRWPGPFGSGFLSPQPPGVVGIGPVAANSPARGQRNLVFFLFGLVFSNRRQGGVCPAHPRLPRT